MSEEKKEPTSVDKLNEISAKSGMPVNDIKTIVFDVYHQNTETVKLENARRKQLNESEREKAKYLKDRNEFLTLMHENKRLEDSWNAIMEEMRKKQSSDPKTVKLEVVKPDIQIVH